MKRRVLCLILAVIMVACLLPTAAFASTNGKTADDAINWVRSLEGQPVGSGECVALIVAYYSYLGQTSPGGNGADYSWNQLPAGWQRLQNAQPQKGDILVYSGNNANPYGHVAIYESDYSTWHQNFAGQRKVVNVTNIRYNGFDNPYWGVIRPDFSSATPKPSYADIGTNVYRYLIRTDGWKHIGTNYDSSNKSNVTISAANTGDPEQVWKFIRQGDGSYYIQNMYSDWYLTYEGNCVQQAKVTTSWLNTNKASRFQWYIYDKNGTFQLVPKDSATAGTWLVLDCTGNYQTAGTQMELYSNWSGAAQIFSLYPVDYQKPAAPPKVKITVPEVVTVGEEVKISWTASPLRDKYDQREYCVTVEGGGSKKVIYTTDTSVSVTIKRRELHCDVTVYSCNTKYANYSSSSYATFKCVEAHEHSYTAVVTAPTCTEKGYTTHTCSCGHSYVDTYTAALGHDWDSGTVTKEPTATETGIRTYTCTRCSATKTETIPKLTHEHSYKAVVTAPTCTEKGYTTHTCACGDSYVDTYTDALGHAWDSGKVTKQPTATETGVRTYTCTRCSATKTETIPATGSVDVTQMFTDVTKNWAYPGIQYCVTHGIMGGMGDGTFAPTGTTTRAQIVQILYNLEGTPAVSGTTPFTDLTANWYKPAILWAYQNNVVAGTSPTTFDPDGPVTREQIAVILTQYMFHVLKMERTWTPADLSTFPDGAQVSGWAKEAMQDAVALGLINGTKAPDGAVYLDPQGSATRQQVATILMNFCQNVKK